jgi:drug/metabolite transporter (DMT)-like permease
MSQALAPRKALTLIGVLTLVWGTNWPLFVYAVQEVSVWTFRAISVLGAGLILLAWAAWRGHSLRVERRHWPRLLAATLMYLVVWNIASAYAAVLIPSGQAAVLGFTMPIWAVLLSAVVYQQKPDRRSALALSVGALGVGLLIWRGAESYAQAPLGLALGLLAGLGWAIGTLILKHKPIAVPAVVLTGWQLLVAAVPISIVAGFLGQGEWFLPSWQTVWVIAYITLVPMALGNATWFEMVGLLPAHFAGLSAVMVPVVAMVSGAMVHNEPLGLIQWAAMACCGTAIFLLLWRR